MKRGTVLLGFALGLGLTWALLWLLGGNLPRSRAQGPDAYSVYYVAVGADC
jgi:hypothetical protein